MTFPDLVRTASEQGLIKSTWTDWRDWREMRNITSHTYDETKALQVVSGIPAFLSEVQDLTQRLEQSQAG